MSLILSVKALFYLIFFVGLTDYEKVLIEEIDNKYSISKSIVELGEVEILIKNSLEVLPNSDQLFWRLGKVYFKLGEKSNIEAEKVHFFSLCMTQTQKALSINSQSASGYFFNGICNGTLGETQGIWSSLSIIKQFKESMEAAINIDPSVEAGGPHRALGNLYLKLPYVLGGNLDHSIEHFKKAIQFGSDFGDNYLGLAEAYIQNDDFILAKKTLYKTLNIKPNSQDEESIEGWQREAHSLLKKIGNE